MRRKRRIWQRQRASRSRKALLLHWPAVFLGLTVAGLSEPPRAAHALPWLAPTTPIQVPSPGRIEVVRLYAGSLTDRGLLWGTRSRDDAATSLQSARVVSGEWASPTTLVERPERGLPLVPSLASNSAGEAVVAWTDEYQEGITTSFREADGEWDTPEDIPREGDWITGPNVVIDGVGDSFVTWGHRLGSLHWEIQASERPFGGPWSPATTLTEELGQPALGALGANPLGDAVAAWNTWKGQERAGIALAMKAPGESWKPISPPVAAPGTGVSRVGIDSAGDVFLLTTRSLGGSEAVAVYTKPAGEEWQPPVLVAPEATRSVGHLALHVDPDGEVTVAIQYGTGSSELGRIVATVRAPDGEWGPSASVSPDDRGLELANLTVNDSGEGVLLWERNVGAERTLEGATLANGQWSAPIRLATEPGTSGLQVTAAVDPAGNLSVAWRSTSELADAIDVETFAASLSDAPAVTDEAVSELGQESVGVTALLDPRGGNAVNCHVQYGTADAYEYEASCARLLQAGSSSTVTAVLTGLTPGRIYHFRFVAANDPGGVAAGQDGAFTTPLPALPEFGRCVRRLLGRYGDPSCTDSAPSGGLYEWVPWPFGGNALIGATGPASVTGASGRSVKCASTTATGQLVGSQAITVSLVFRGCKGAKGLSGTCQSEGASLGEIRSASLSGLLGTIKSGRKPTVGVRLAPPYGSGLVMASCGGSQITISGAVIGAMARADTPTNTYSLRFRSHSRIQVPEAFEGAAPSLLRLETGAGEEPATLKLSGALTSEGESEIKAEP